MISKRTLSYLALEAALVSCAPETVDRAPAAPVNWNPVTHAPTTSGPPRASAKERSAADAYAAALGGASLERLGAVLDEDAHFAFAGMKDAHGRDQVVAAHAALFAAFDERVLSPTRVWLTDSSQGVEWTLTGTHARTWMGVPATGHRVSVKGLSLLWTRDDGSINDVHVIFDEEVVRVQLGLPRKELASVASVAPGTGAPSRETLEQARTPEEEANVATVRAALNALENGNEAEYLGAFAADVAVDDPGEPCPERRAR